MQISTGLPRPSPLALCILKAQEVTTKGVYRLTLLSTTVASPCQTLGELPARVCAYNYSPTHQLAVPCMRSSPKVCTLVLFVNSRRACAARVTVVVLSVCLSVCVCVSTLILAIQATRRPISDTSGFRTTQAGKIKGRIF